MGRNDASNRPSVSHRSRPPPLVDTTCAAPEERPKLETGSTRRLSDNVRQSVSSRQASEHVSELSAEPEYTAAYECHSVPVFSTENGASWHSRKRALDLMEDAIREMQSRKLPNRLDDTSRISSSAR